MPKGFNLRCAAGKTARVWLQGKGGPLTTGQASGALTDGEAFRPIHCVAAGNACFKSERCLVGGRVGARRNVYGVFLNSDNKGPPRY